MKFLVDFFKFYPEDYGSSNNLNSRIIHAEWLSVTMAIVIIFVYIYSKLDKETQNKVIRRAAAFLLATEILRSLWAVTIKHYSLNSMLPLHLCGIMIFIEYFGVKMDNRFLKEFAYYCGLPGAFIGLLTPEFSGFVLFSFQYLIYIIRHGLLVLLPLLWILADKFVPTKISVVKSFVLLVFLAVLDAIINTYLHSNYMFISSIPNNTYLIKLSYIIGYKGYVIFVSLSALLVICLMYYISTIASKHVRFNKH